MAGPWTKSEDREIILYLSNAHISLKITFAASIDSFFHQSRKFQEPLGKMVEQEERE